MTEAPLTTSPRFRRLAAASAFSSLFSFAITVTIIPAAANEILTQLCHNSKADFGLIYPVWMIGFFTCVLIGGRYADRRGKLPVLAAGCVLMAIGCAMFGRASLYYHALASAFVMGAGGGFSEAIAMALIADIFGGSRRTAMMNVAQFFFAAGAVAGPVTTTSLLAAGYDWRWAFIGTASACAVAAVICLVSLARSEETPLAHAHDGDWKTLLQDRLVLLLALGILLYVGAETGQESWLAVYFKQDLKSAGPLAAATVAIFWASIGLGRVTAVWLSRHVSDYALITWCMGAAAIFEAILLLSRSPGLGLAAVILLGYTLGPVWPTIVSRAGAAHPMQSGAVLAVVVAAGGVGAAFLPPLIGQAADLVGLRNASWICFVLAALNFAMFFGLWRRSRAVSGAQ